LNELFRINNLFLVELAFNGSGNIVNFIQSLVNLSFVFLEERSDERVVDDGGALGLGIEQIDV